MKKTSDSIYQGNDPVLIFLLEAAKSERKISKVVLFGSRARDNHHERSDYDVAIDAPGFTDLEWNCWSLEIQESVPTLCGLDLIRLGNNMSKGILESIQKEGRVIYERK